MKQAGIERSTTLDLAWEEAWERVVGDFAAWFGDGALLDPRLGGEVVSGSRVGRVTTYEPGHRIGWEWSMDGDPGWTAVDITLQGERDRTVVTVTETLHEWEHEHHAARGMGRSGASGVLAVAG